MSISKLHISQKLIEEFVKSPPSLKEQTLTTLAIQLCQTVELKKAILCVSEATLNSNLSYEVWEMLVESRSVDLFEKLPLTPTLKYPLIVRIRSVAMQLFSWNREHQVLFKTSPLFTDSLLTSFDWTVEGRLDERRISHRLVQDERIPVCKRYRLACLHCLEHFIIPLWNKVSLECRKEYLGLGEYELIKMWCNHLTQKPDVPVGPDDIFWKFGLQAAARDGFRTAAVHCWNKLSESAKHEVIIETTTEIMSRFIGKNCEDWGIFHKKGYDKWHPSSAHYADIFYFLLSEMSPNQRAAFFQDAVVIHHDVLDRLLQWPYQDLFLPVVSKLWDFLPEWNFVNQLLQLACRYNETSGSVETHENAIYDYGGLLVELLEQSPDQLRRTIFDCNTKLSIHLGGSDIEANVAELLLLEVIVKNRAQYRDMDIFQRILQQATAEGKKSFIHSGCGEKICKYLAMTENWYLFDWMLKQCLSDDAVMQFKKLFLLSDAGHRVCFWMLMKINDESVKSLFNWAGLSSDEISGIKTKILSTPFLDELVKILQDSSGDTQIDCLDNLMRSCLPEDAREQYKEQFIEINAMPVCLHFMRYADLEKATQFLNWCFPSENDLLQFKRQLFDDKGVSLVTDCISNREWSDVERFIQWFRLCPEEIEKLKKDVLFSCEVVETIFCAIPFDEEKMGTAVSCVKWGLEDEEGATALKETWMTYARNNPRLDIEGLHLLRIFCDKIIELRLRDLESEKRDKTQ